MLQVYRQCVPTKVLPTSVPTNPQCTYPQCESYAMCILYNVYTQVLPNGVPMNDAAPRDVMMTLCLRTMKKGHREKKVYNSRDDAYPLNVYPQCSYNCVPTMCTQNVTQQCDHNVYPQCIPTTERQLNDIYESLRGLKKFSKKTPGYWKKCTPFLENLSTLFDIGALRSYRLVCEKVWKLKMTSTDELFYENQKKNPTCWLL